jgi:hypothetical protein
VEEIMASFTDIQIRNMVENYRKKLGIRRKIEVVIHPMNHDGLGRPGKIWINSKLLSNSRYSDDAVRRLVVHEMMHAWKAEYGKGGPKLNRGHSPAFYRAYRNSIDILGIPDIFHERAK